ncbi:MAG TPA: hypothetical protein VFW16_05105 [Streptosporangiaceae bacterium]|nr:hypothetical protein [Streptosporangiaceae bacterium]
MRYRLLASYQGAGFEAGVGPEDTGVVLFAACPPPEALGFEPATGHWRKQVDRADVQTLYESRPVGTFRGERCVVLDDLTDRLHIAYLGHDAYRAEQLGYWEVDRGVFELITPRQEVTEIVEQRLPVAAPGAPGHGGERANGSGPHPPSPDLLSMPQYSVPAGQGARRPVETAPAADKAPLPLEAEAMRAARKAKQDQPDSRPAQSAPAGLSEPSSVVPSMGDTTASVPSWSPQSPAPPPPGPDDAGGNMPPGHGQSLGVSLQPAPSVPGAPGTVPGSTSISNSPGALNPAAPGAHAADGQINGAYHDCQPTGATTPPGHGLPRDQFERPLPGPAVAVAVADPILTAPYAPVAPVAPGVPEAPGTQPASRRRRAARRRLPTQRIFSELAAQAGISASAYAVNDDVDGAMCLVRTGEGFEVFNSLAGARHEVRVFRDEESAYFYLFGVLAAEAVRTGVLRPAQ